MQIMRRNQSFVFFAKKKVTCFNRRCLQILQTRKNHLASQMYPLQNRDISACNENYPLKVISQVGKALAVTENQ